MRVGLERIEAFKLLIEDGEWLELLGANERSAEPSLDLVGFGWRQGRVGIVEVSIQLEQRDLSLLSVPVEKCVSNP